MAQLKLYTSDAPQAYFGGEARGVYTDDSFMQTWKIVKVIYKFTILFKMIWRKARQT